VTKKSHIDRLIELGLWSKQAAQLAELLGKEQLELMLRARDAIRRFETMDGNPLNMHEAAPLLRKALTRTLIENRAFEKATQARRERVAEEKKVAHAIAARLRVQHSELKGPGKTSKLAKKVREELSKNGKPPKSIRVLRRWLAKHPPKK